MAGREDDPNLIDLTGFTNPEESLRRACVGLDQYSEIAKRHLQGATLLTLAHHAIMGFVSRARGLHEGTVREIRNANPHAVRSLKRDMLELATLILYVNRNPDYLATVVGVGDARYKRKSYESMFHAVRDIAPGLKNAYRELSDFTHFGPVGVASPMSIISEEDQTVGWTDRPRWRSEREFHIACAQTEELVELLVDALREFGEKYLIDVDPADSIATIFESRPLDE